MTETIVTCAVLIASACAAPTPRSETLIRLTVDATPAPKPALKYLLLPELKEMTQGNPIPNYAKCVLEHDAVNSPEPFGRDALRLADRAARMDRPDWQMLPKLKTDGIDLLLPDVQKMRTLASGLQVRFHDEVVRCRFDDAVVTAKTMFSLSRHLGEHPTIIGGLVAIAIATIAVAPFEEMLGQPGCPNFYWALTGLPHPLISFDRGLEGERLMIGAELRDLDDQNPMTTAQLKKLIAHLDRIGRPKMIEWLAARAKDEDHMAAARRRLVASGVPGERLARFSPFQVLLLDEKLEYEIQQDEGMKLMPLPTWEAVARLIKLPEPKGRLLVNGLLASLHTVRLAQGRLEQRLALLRHVEALRLHAAAHAGALPARLADVDVPLPADPFTGQAFRYELIDGVAHLRGSPPVGKEDAAVYNFHYEITIRK